MQRIVRLLPRHRMVSARWQTGRRRRRFGPWGGVAHFSYLMLIVEGCPLQEKEAKKEKKAEKKPEAQKPAADEVNVAMVDIRVGVIKEVKRHPNADALYVESIDLGEAEPRTVVSGLVKFYSEEEMLGARVCVVCNLKPAKMRDVLSSGMVLCSSNEDHTVVKFVDPPEGAKVGERIKFEGYDGEPEAVLNPKKKQFDKVLPPFNR